MEVKKKFSFKERIKSFSFAINGLKFFFQHEHNARIHLFFAFAAILAGFFFQLSNYEWCIILLCIAMVFALEIVNTAIEKIVDHLSPEKSKFAGIAKDLAAAAVLVTAIMATIIGIIIFLPKIVHLF